MAETEKKNARLIEEIGALARDLGCVNADGTPSFRQLALAMERSHSLFAGILQGSEPQASTLLQVARKAGVSPLRLYEAAGWFTVEDVITYILDKDVEQYRLLRDDPARLAAVLGAGPLSVEAAEALAESTRPLLRLLADEQRAERRGQLFPDDSAHQDR